MTLNAFDDVLESGENVLVALGAPGEDAKGAALGWIQVALTEHRFIVARVEPDLSGHGYRVGSRQAYSRTAIDIQRHPRTEEASARLEFYGVEGTLRLVDLDRPELFAQLPAFLSAWPRPIGGTGSIALQIAQASPALPLHQRITRLPGIAMGLVMGVGLGLLILWWLN